MHVIAFEVQNYLRVEMFKVVPKGKHVVISARNGEGKTSIVTALFDLLCSISQKKQPEPVHRGAEKAYLRLELEDYVIEKHITNGSPPKLKITKSDGTKVLSPQKLLDGWLNTFALDPVAWLKQRPQDQLDAVLQVCGVKPPVEAVREITGADHPALASESANAYMMRLSADEAGEYYRARRDMNRQVDDCAGAVKKQQALIESLPRLEEQRSSAEILEMITALEAKQAEYVSHKKEIDMVQGAHRDCESLLADLSRQRDRGVAAVLDAEKRINEARDVIAVKESIILAQEQKKQTAAAADNALVERIEKGKIVTANNLYALNVLLAKEIPDFTPQISELRKEWKQADSQGAQRIKNQQAEERLTELQADYQAKKNRHQALDTILTKLRQLRKDLLEGVDFGVKGLAVGNSELLLDDLPFSQASLAKSLRVALAVIMRQDADLKLIRIDNGEMLDEESEQLVFQAAKENGWQVIMTRVSNDKELRVELVDGEDN